MKRQRIISLDLLPKHIPPDSKGKSNNRMEDIVLNLSYLCHVLAIGRFCPGLSIAKYPSVRHIAVDMQGNSFTQNSTGQILRYLYPAESRTL